jgi:hypothetical protein
MGGQGKVRGVLLKRSETVLFLVDRSGSSSTKPKLVFVVKTISFPVFLLGPILQNFLWNKSTFE